MYFLDTPVLIFSARTHHCRKRPSFHTYSFGEKKDPIGQLLTTNYRYVEPSPKRIFPSHYYLNLFKSMLSSSPVRIKSASYALTLSVECSPCLVDSLPHTKKNKKNILFRMRQMLALPFYEKY